MKMKITHSLVALSLLGSSLAAAPIAKEDGFSGFVAGGVSSMKIESNMYSGTATKDDMTHRKIDNINSSPDTDTATLATFNYNLKYTFAEAQTEIYLGTLLESVLTFDGTTALGVRKNFNGVGIFGVALLKSSLPTKTWEDPYNTDGNRNKTDMTSKGLSLKWESIMESNFDVELRTRSYDLDHEHSGENAPYEGQKHGLGLTGSHLNDKLDREGDMRQLIAAYRWKISDKHLLRTALRFSDYDLDGSAMQYKRAGLKLDYLYTGQKWNFVGVFNLSQDSYDNNNPLYDDKADATNVGGAVTALYKDPFGWSKDLALTGTVGYYDSDSDIDFYDSNIRMVNVGVLYKF